ncbi:MAG TPA: hypothetical protein VID50_10100 [Candidatus Eisenbacteria bacterium]|jgi:hypothetical protein
MSRASRSGSLPPAAVFLAALLTVARPGAAAGDPVRAADASVLYNAGTRALERDELGEAVAFLRAAERVDPRAADVRRNLREARVRAAAARGADPPSGAAGAPISAPEGWWLASGLLVLGAILASAAPRGGTGILRRAGQATLLGGILLFAWLSLRAREEWRYPSAVVVAPSLPAGPAPDERPRPPYLLGVGEEVRLGRMRGALVEIRVGGSVIGWAARSGVWRVADAARYTPRLGRP